MSWSIALAGFLIGTLVGLTGVGAGSLTLPTLIHLGVAPSVAVGTDLAFSAVTKLVGAAQHARQGTVDRRWLLVLAVAGVPATLLGTWLVPAMRHAMADEERLLRHALGVMLIVAALGTIANEVLRRRRPVGRGGGVTAAAWVGVAVVGLLVGLTSVGSGTLLTPLLLLTSRLPLRKVVGTTLAGAFLLVAAGAVAHAAVGTVNGLLAANLLIGSLPGVWLGGRLTLHVPERPLKVTASGLVLLAGLKLLA
jgi:uncharacterized membrane protein YfcA